MLDLSQIQANLLVSTAPLSKEDVGELGAHHVTAVLSLQTDDDLTEHGLRWEQLVRWYSAAGIVPTRVPIRDFSAEDLAARLDEAVTALAALLATGHIVCLHCTVGINRSPTVAIAYLVKVQGCSLVDALNLVTTARPRVQPDLRALDRLTSN